MTTLQERVRAHFEESIAAKRQTVEVLAEPTAEAAMMLIECLMNDGKILVCGNGGSAADAQHFAAELTGRFEKERMELAAIALTTDTSALTAIGNDYGFEHIFSKQVRALGRPGDVLLGISTSGNSGNVIEAIKAAHERDMRILAFTGRDAGKSPPCSKTTTSCSTSPTRAPPASRKTTSYWCTPCATASTPYSWKACKAV